MPSATFEKCMNKFKHITTTSVCEHCSSTNVSGWNRSLVNDDLDFLFCYNCLRTYYRRAKR